MPPASVNLVHGVRVRSSEAIPGASGGPPGPVELELRVDEPCAVPASPGPGQVVASLDGSGRSYAATLNERTLLIRFFGTAEFEVDLDAGTVNAHATSAGTPGLIPLLFSGNVLALVLGMRGIPTIHASTVSLGESAIAFAGPAGAGKSTAAALACLAGALLVTDDLARVGLDPDPVVHRGIGELRLREPAAEALADRLSTRSRPTLDGRVAVEVDAPGEPVAPLGSLAFPTWPAGTGSAMATRLSPRAALDRLLGLPRVIGWQATEPIRAHFDLCAELANRVPAYELSLPKDRLTDPTLPEELRAAL